MKSLTHRFLLCLVSLVLGTTGCQRQTALVPPAIHFGVETCTECGMIINDSHYVAALAWRDPSDGTIQTFAFDDIGCLLAWRHHHAGVQIVAVWVKDERTTAWLDATAAVYVKSPRLQTPMGWGIAAGITTNDLAGLPVQQPMLGWSDLLNARMNEANAASPADPNKK